MLGCIVGLGTVESEWDPGRASLRWARRGAARWMDGVIYRMVRRINLLEATKVYP